MSESDWRAAIGPVWMYDILGMHQLDVLITLGLRERHSVLDVGAGILRAGRFIAEYTSKYYVVEPNNKLLERGFKHVVPKAKVAGWSSSKCFDFSSFGIKFDYILAHALLTHLDIKDIKGFFVGAKQSMHADSFLLATVHIDPDSANKARKSWTIPLIPHTEGTIVEAAKIARLRATFLGIAHPMGQRWVLGRLYD